MKHRQSKYTAEQIAQAYILRATTKKSDAEICRAVGIPGGYSLAITGTLRKYITGDSIPSHVSPQVREAFSIVKKTLGGVQAPEAQKTNGINKPVNTNTDNLKKLEEAFTTFQEAIVDVIVSEAENRAKQQVESKEKEITALKDKYENELIRLQTIIASAKDSSLVGMITRKWGQK